MALSRPRYSKIERLASDLLSESKIKRPPVPIEAMVRSRDIEIHFGKLEDVSGLIVREGNHVFIGINEDDSDNRQRFTLAHEFGHFLLHPGQNAWYDRKYRSEISSKAVDVEEIEANFFAASILMPPDFLRKDQAQRYVDIEDGDAVKDLAKKYNVSTQAMNLRLLNLIGRL
jgi:Zn-dependent peptidase ImmA (M78 family)